MRQSALFTKTRRAAPADETAKNAQLLVRAGYVHKEMAGVYDYLPLGLRVIEKIKHIVREEMNAIGGQEILMSSLQRKDVWERTDRWDETKVDVWFKTKLAAGGEIGFGWSHEEPITDLMRQFVSSYRDVPLYAYQFQTKMRNELRAKSGILRGREFIMKDLYSYAPDAESHQRFYDAVIAAYVRIFARAGLAERTFLTFASGGAFTQFSHEFQTLCDAGEDTIYLHRGKKIAINEEVMTDEVLAQLGVAKNELEKQTAVEVGNIFDFGGAKSKQLGLLYKNEKDEEVPVHLGSYGIGITRLMGTIVETMADSRGIVWPASVAPFDAHLVSLARDEADELSKTADALYEELSRAGIETLYDDRKARAGEKFADADLIGIPARIIVGKEAAETGVFEVVDRATGSVKKVPRAKLAGVLAESVTPA